MRTAFAFALLGLGFGAHAGPAAEAKALARREEAIELVRQISRGEGNTLAAISRLEFLDEEDYASVELANRLRREIEVRKRRNLAMALAQLGRPAAMASLYAALDDEDGAVRMYAVKGLGRMDAREATKKLMAALGDKTSGVRREAAIALGGFKDRRLGALLLAAAKTEGEVDVRATMLTMVGKSGDRRQGPGLEEFLGSSSEGTRYGAAQGLCLLGLPKGYEYARKLVASGERTERLQGVKLFEGSSARAAAPVLAPLLVDADPAVAALAARLLYQGGDAKKLDWLVLRSHRTTSLDERMYFERELELLRLADDQRKAILLRAGIK